MYQGVGMTPIANPSISWDTFSDGLDEFLKPRTQPALSASQADHCRTLIAALRSGKYEQHTQELRNPNGNAMCAEGVACDVYDNRLWGRWSHKPFSEWFYADELHVKGWPTQVAGYFGLRGGFVHRDLAPQPLYGLIGMNDKLGWSFLQIADALEWFLGDVEKCAWMVDEGWRVADVNAP